MSDPYQLGSDIEWLRHNKDEAERALKRKSAQLTRSRFLCFLLLLALGWTVYQFTRKHPIEELWNVKSLPLPFGLDKTS
ncbi:MAG TPA: hypothetical protein VLD18_08855, partial [Verrucomicrobiae bacterium]|nr:hypothetical protein [Verrucomicrobiae bacterium]